MTTSFLVFTTPENVASSPELFVKHALKAASTAKTLHLHLSLKLPEVLPILEARFQCSRQYFRDYFYTLTDQDLIAKNYWLRKRQSLPDKKEVSWSLKYDVSEPFKVEGASMNAISYCEETKTTEICRLLGLKELTNLKPIATYSFVRVKFFVPECGSIVIDSTETGYGKYYTITTVVMEVHPTKMPSLVPISDLAGQIVPGAHVRSKVVEHLWLGNVSLYSKLEANGHVKDETFYQTEVCYSDKCPLGDSSPPSNTCTTVASSDKFVYVDIIPFDFDRWERHEESDSARAKEILLFREHLNRKS